jgi:site-specific DNA-methyltransferase (adenine-specific)
MVVHEIISIFYSKLGTYNIQKIQTKAMNTVYKSSTPTENYGKYHSYITKKENINTKERNPQSIIHGMYMPNNSKERVGHPTQKPLDLINYFIKTYSNEDEIVLDNCMGSGTTAIACINLNRKFIGIEKDKKYFSVAVNRIKEHLEKK